MKKLLIMTLISLQLMFFVTCKKDSPDIPIGTIKVDIDGSSKTFSVQAKATRLSVPGGNGIQIQGYFKTSSTTNLSFSIVSPNPISAGTYTENTAGNPLVTMTHCTEVLFPCIIRADSYKSNTNPVSVTITEITGSYVKGTFKGELQSTGAGNSTLEVLKNGVFYVSF